MSDKGMKNEKGNIGEQGAIGPRGDEWVNDANSRHSDIEKEVQL